MSDSEYEDEEFLVFADFSNQLAPIEFSDENCPIKIIGLDGKEPIAEINGNIFKGNYDFAMGTNVFFEKDLNVPAKDPLYNVVPRQNYKFAAKTNKVINFQRIYIERNCEDITTTTNDTKTDTDDELKISLTHEEAIKLFPSVNDTNWNTKAT